MQILSFEDEGIKAPNRRKSSRSLLILGLVGALFGISTAFASSTITINTDNKVNLGQGVVKVSGCDTSIDVVPSTTMALNETGTPTFYLDKITISNIDTRTADAEGNGCANKIFDIQIFHGDSAIAYPCSTLDPSKLFNVTYNPNVAIGTTPEECSGSTVSFKMPPQTSFSVNTNPVFTLHFNNAPSDISYITLVSRS